VRKRPLGRPKRRWENNIKINLLVVRYEGMGWIDLAQDRLVADACEYVNEHSGFVKCGEFLDWLRTG